MAARHEGRIKRAVCFLTAQVAAQAANYRTALNAEVSN